MWDTDPHPQTPCPTLQTPLSHGFGAAPGAVDRTVPLGTNP